jgi:hypothetical protein
MAFLGVIDGSLSVVALLASFETAQQFAQLAEVFGHA